MKPRAPIKRYGRIVETLRRLEDDETFVEMGRQHYGGDLAGRWLLTAGLGGMGGAQPLAAVMAGASCLAIECHPSRIEMQLRTGYLDRRPGSLDEALAIIERSCENRAPVSVGLVGNACEILPELFARGRVGRRRPTFAIPGQ